MNETTTPRREAPAPDLTEAGESLRVAPKIGSTAAAAGRTGDANKPIGPEGGQIRRLDAHTVNQIAAGEVIERPAAVVKELVENALDAGARRIEIDLEESGTRRIRVADDGHGMTPEDALRAMERHATSKIRRAEDLLGVRTLGFRGEALPSIASVSRFCLETAPGDGPRARIEAEGGRVRLADDVGAGPRGTEVTVDDLFYNTPARRKFLKTPATELAACLETVTRAALAHPGVAFRVRHGGRLALETTGRGDLRETILDVWGREIGRAMVPVELATGRIRVTGFVAPPTAHRPNRAYQITLVNGRPVRSRTLLAALDRAYRDLTPERRYPPVVLALTVEPGEVDVNVSPTKSEVRFESEGSAFEAVRLAVKSALLGAGLVPEATERGATRSGREVWGEPGNGPGVMAAQAPLGTPDLRVPDGGASGSQGRGDVQADDAYARLNVWLGLERGEPDPGAVPGMTTRGGAAFAHGAAAADWANQPPLPLGESAGLPGAAESEAGASGDARRPFAFLLENRRIVGQLMNSFILVETARGLAIVDQHVAHERVLVEEIIRREAGRPEGRQRLLVPETLELDRPAAVLLRERLDELNALGFEVEPFGGDTFLVRAVPSAVSPSAARRVLREIAHELAAGEGSVASPRERLWILASCKMAIKAGDPLGMAEMERLIARLGETENPYLCPHGRPVTVLLSTRELLRRFGRSG